MLLILAGTSHVGGPNTRRVLNARDFGAVGDGRSDDGPPILRMLQAMPSTTPVTLHFGRGKTYFVRNFPHRYLFDFRDRVELVLDGQRCTFELDPRLRFLRLTGCRRVRVRCLRVDFRPLPFADGVVTSVDNGARTLTVQLPPEEASRVLGGPTHEDGEQAFFGMLWYDGPFAPLGRHLWIDQVTRGDSADRVTVHPSKEFVEYGDVVPRRWRVSLPVPGIAHRYGPGACFDLRDNDTLDFDDVELWSAPWMGFAVARNSGRVRFHSVHIRPRPGSGRLMSTWRDGFHVKGNRGELVWEDCILSGMNDDAFNISTHASVIRRVLTPRSIEVRQKFPLLYIPWRPGDTIIVADERERRLVAKARVASVEEGPEEPPINGEAVAPAVRLELNAPIEHLRVGHMVWNADAANPRTTLRRCTVEMSCRLQSPVALNQCNVTGLLWFYCDPVEGPFPGPVSVRGCKLRLGRGNPVYCVVVSGEPDSSDPAAGGLPRAIHDFEFTGNTVEGGFAVRGVERLRVENNAFLRGESPVEMSGNSDAVVRNNRMARKSTR